MSSLRFSVRTIAAIVAAALLAACASLLGIEDGVPRDDADAGDACGNTAVDIANCGSCGHVCATGQVCSNGVCKSACDAPFASCAGAQGCVDLSKDVKHCGACTTVCQTTDAGAVDSGGGEASADAGPGPDYGTPACVKSACTIACSATKQNCSGQCFDTKSDHEHCGDCVTNCTIDQTCSNSHCCPIGQGYCNGACVNVETDPTNCGQCGVTCSGNTPLCFDAQCTSGLSIVVEGHKNVLANCAPGDFSCEAHEVCNKVTGLACVFQPYDCYFGNQGSWYPPDGLSGSSNFNFAYTYDLGGGTWGNICGCNPSQMIKYGLSTSHPGCGNGTGHWVRQ